MDEQPICAAETPRLWLELLSVPKHLDDFHDIWSNPKAMVWSSKTPSKNIEESLAYFLPNVKSADRPFVEDYAAVLKPEVSVTVDSNTAISKPKMIGIVGIIRESEYDYGKKTAPELGYCVHIDYRGKGFATEMLQGFLKLYWSLPERKGVTEISAFVDTENYASARIMEKAGAKKTGERSKYELPAKGPRDSDIWLLKRPN